MKVLAENTDTIDLKVGDKLILENFRLPVIPPHLNLEAFLNLPDSLVLVKTEYPEQEGTFESIFYIEAKSPGKGTLKIGYKDWDTNSNAKEKNISIKVS